MGKKTDEKGQRKKVMGQKALAFNFRSANRAKRQQMRRLDLETKKHNIPMLKNDQELAPPIIVAIVGATNVGKSTMLKSLLRCYTRQGISNICGPLTVVVGKKRRIIMIECKNDINAMIDIAKIADVVLLMIDATFGLDMEVFEFLHIAQVHGLPRVIGVITHLDNLRDNKSLQKYKKKLKHRFWAEVYQGAKIFYMCDFRNDQYGRKEIARIARYLTDLKFRPMEWRLNHPYLLCDRLEDITDPEVLRIDPTCSRRISLYGYLQGTNMLSSSKVHISGVGDYSLNSVSFLPDPCPFPDGTKNRRLDERERQLYAPFSNLGNLVYDKDAVYVDIGLSKNQRSNELPARPMFLSSLIEAKYNLKEKMSKGSIQMFASEDESDGDSDIGSDENENSADSDSAYGLTSKVDSEMDEQDECIDFDDDTNQSESDYDEMPKKSNFDSPVETFNHMNEYSKNNCIVSTSEFFKEHAPHISLKNFIYGSGGDSKQNEDSLLLPNVGSSNVPDQDLVAGIFYRSSVSLQQDKLDPSSKDAFDTTLCTQTKFLNHTISSDPEQSYRIVRNRFVTGVWNEEDQKELDNDMEIENDFEECDEIENDKSVNDEEFTDYDDDDDNEVEDNELKNEKSVPFQSNEQVNAKKRKKQEFDEEFDQEKRQQFDMGDQYYKNMKENLESQAEANKQEFMDMDDETRLKYEGFRPGMYLRIEITDVPCEFVNNFDPTYPILIGALLPGEDTLGFTRFKVKRHHWYKKVLKNRDPIILSVGWRRFQTVPLYSMEDHNLRQRAIKYTPSHLHCMATCYTPACKSGTPILAIQKPSDKNPDFRICMSGVAVSMDQTVPLVKKLKLIGTPMQIFKNSVFIKGMFTSALEVAKFEGAKLRTVSGIRGVVKKAIRESPGAFRATFEDKILKSEIVFLRTWYPVQCPEYYNLFQNLLLPLEERTNWVAMRTVGDLRAERGIPVPVNNDSLYKTVPRSTPQKMSFRIPKSLEKKLPFKSKPKISNVPIHHKDPIPLDKKEKSLDSLLNELTALHRVAKKKRDEKDKVANQKRMVALAQSQVEIQKKRKQQRKQMFAMQARRPKKK